MPPTSKALLAEIHHNTGATRNLHFYAKGETIPMMSHGLWRVCQGLAQLSTLYPNGEEGLLGWVGPSMCFGLWLTSLQAYRATATSDVYLMWYSRVAASNGTAAAANGSNFSDRRTAASR
jgi:hypothetical protein